MSRKVQATQTPWDGKGAIGMKNHLTCGSFEFQVPLREGAVTVRIERLEIQFETSPEIAQRYLELLQQTFDELEHLVRALQGVTA